MLRLSTLHIYPIKSLGGITLSEAQVTDRGLAYDRRWMLVDEQHQAITQRRVPSMTLLQPVITGDTLQVHRRDKPNVAFTFPLQPPISQRVTVQVFEDVCEAVPIGAEADAWFSQQLGMACQLVHMPDDSLRPVDEQYAQHGEVTSFSDAYPLLVIGQASLDHLNERLEIPLPMNRFRPNLVFTGGEAHAEDKWPGFTIGGAAFTVAKPCARCVVTTIDQQTAARGKEPLKTLSTYRQQDHKILFGQNVLVKQEGSIAVGQIIVVDG